MVSAFLNRSALHGVYLTTTNDFHRLKPCTEPAKKVRDEEDAIKLKTLSLIVTTL